MLKMKGAGPTSEEALRRPFGYHQMTSFPNAEVFPLRNKCSLVPGIASADCSAQFNSRLLSGKRAAEPSAAVRMNVCDRRIRGQQKKSCTPFSKAITLSQGLSSMSNRMKSGTEQDPFAAARAEVAKESRAATASALTAFLSHELNQPLAALVTNAQAMNRWIDKEIIDVAALRRITDRLVGSSLRASEIVRDVRRRASKTRCAPVLFSVPDLVLEVLGVLEAERDSRSIIATLSQGGDHASITGVRAELAQVLVNIVTNSIDALENTPPHDRRIEIMVTSFHDRLSIIVRDTGPGIGHVDLEQMATPFYTSKKNGIGLGLFVSRSFVEAAGGTLSASNHPDGGARFEIGLPLEEFNE